MESQRNMLRDDAERGCLSSYEYDTWLTGIDDDPALLLIIANDHYLALTRDAVAHILDGNLYGVPGLLNESCQILTLWCDVRRTNIDPTPIRVLFEMLTSYAVKRKRLPPERDQRRLEVDGLERTFSAAQQVIDRISNVARHEIRTAAPRLENRRQCRIRLHPTNGVAMLDDEPFNIKPKQYDLLAFLLNANGEYAPLDSMKLRSRDVDGLPEKLREAIETQPGAGTRIKPDFWLS